MSFSCLALADLPEIKVSISESIRQRFFKRDSCGDNRERRSSRKEKGRAFNTSPYFASHTARGLAQADESPFANTRELAPVLSRQKIHR